MSYEVFFEKIENELKDPSNQVVSYYGVREDNSLQMFCTIKNTQTDHKQTISYSMLDEPGLLLVSLSGSHPQTYDFESSISSSLGINFASICSK